MVRVRQILSAVGLVVWCSTVAYAQFPKWDAGGSWGLVFADLPSLEGCG